MDLRSDWCLHRTTIGVWEQTRRCWRRRNKELAELKEMQDEDGRFHKVLLLHEVVLLAPQLS